MNEYYTISDDKLAEVTDVLTARGYEPEESSVRGFLLADWHEGEEHQRFIDTAPATEIVDWMEACTWEAMG